LSETAATKRGIVFLLVVHRLKVVWISPQLLTLVALARVETRVSFAPEKSFHLLLLLEDFVVRALVGVVAVAQETSRSARIVL
jgi:hypothetical protein